jgi:hypothetical protein
LNLTDHKRAETLIVLLWGTEEEEAARPLAPGSTGSVFGGASAPISAQVIIIGAGMQSRSGVAA